MRSINLASWFVAAFVLWAGAATSSATTLTVTLNTAGLPAGDYLFDFQFINGDGATGNNTSAISGFSSTNLALGSLSTFGSVTGSDLVSGLTLKDGPTTEVDQEFTALAAASDVSFMLNYTENYVPPGPGDAFTFAITDTSLNSTRSEGDGAELEIDMTGPGSPVYTFPADAAYGAFEAGTGGGAATPEIRTMALSGCGLFLIGGLVRRDRRPKKT